MADIQAQIQAYLLSCQDVGYRDFQRKIITNIDSRRIIGVRMPVLRAYARTLAATPAAEAFLRILPHEYYEENNLHGLLIGRIPDFPAALAEMERFLPYVDNWSTCDMCVPKAFLKNPAAIREKCEQWLQAKAVYTIRFGIGMLMRMFLDDAFTPDVLESVARVRSEEYYVNMMIAWFFATALAKHDDAAVRYLVDGRLSVWTHNTTIRKAIESDRISEEQKRILRTLKR